MKKFSQIVENNNVDTWSFVIEASFEGFDPCKLSGTIEVEIGTSEGEVGEMIDKKMDDFTNLVDFKMLSMDKK